MQRTLALLVLLIAGWAVPGTVSARTATGSSARASAPAARAAGEYVPLEAGTTYKAYFDNSLYGWENVCIYMWDSQTGYEIFGGWCGEPVTDVEVIGGKEYYVKTFTTDIDVSLPMIIFNDNNGEQTSDMEFYDGGVYNADSELIDIFENQDANTPKAPRFSRTSGEFYQDFTLELTDLNEPPATIYYTLDGSEPSATNGQKYTSGINIAAGSDVTVKAVAVTETGTSSVATATYRFVSKHLLTVKIPNKNAISNLYLSSDAEYGEFNTDGSMYITDGMTVYVGYYLNSGYVCNSVKLGGVSYDVADRYFDFQMPASDTELEIITEYNPSSPSDPQPGDTEKKYTLTLVCNPTGAGSLSGAGTYAAETSVYVSTSPKTGYVFTGWTMDGETVTTDRNFYMGMPSSDMVLTANYVYNPSSPSEPDQPRLRHPLTATASPSGSGTFSTSATEVTFGEEYYVYASPKTGYKFKGWIVNGVAQEEKSTTLRGVMTDAGAHVVGLFVYDPSSPTNPGANYYNPTTGQVIIDDFTPDYLYNALVTVLAGADFDNVSSIIVKGQMTYGDFGTLINLKNASTIDLSRVGGTTVVPGYAFQDMAAANISLSSAITEIGSNAFYRCQNLVSLTVYAQEPPACNSSTFSNFTNKENCTVFVPASAIELYSNAPYWKDFTIMPITNDAHVLQVNLPADAADGRYKHNSLEIVNINSGIRQKYVVSDRMLYTFNGLQKDEQYNIYMLSQAGLEIGRIENVVMPDHDLEVTFDNMKTLHSVYAKVLDTDGKEVTDQTTVEWLKPLADGTVTYLRKAVSLGEVPEGQNLICRVTLGERLGTAYPTPDDVEFTVSGADNTCEITLVPFRTIALSGTIADGDGAPISGASVSASQTMNGRFSKTYTAKTDRQGKWSVAVLDAPETRMTYAAPECVNVNDTIGAFEANVNALDLGTKTLRSIVGARVNYGFTYKAAGVEEIENSYADYQNVAVSVYNVTQDRAHNEVSLQYPVLAVLDENINAGDELRLTATSKTGAFNPIVKTVAVDDSQRAEVTFDIVGKGGISASFEMTDNPAVTAMLYGSNGELAKKMAYTEAKALFTELEDGEYTLITMGQSDLMNSILRLSNYAEIGLTEGKDYVKNTVTVETGKLAEVKIPEVPAFDESLFYYTGNTTGFSANKSSITTGGYLTLRANIDFKGVYKNDVSNVALVVDLPDACDFVEQSVVQGPNLLPYTLDSKRLTIQLGDNYGTQTRFCVVPTTGGSFNATASIVFDYNGKTLTQPIGSATSQIKTLEFIVPSSINTLEFKATGMAPAGSRIEVYEGEALIGTTNALAKGTWTAECVLADAYNMTSHAIHATITTKEGLEMRTETVTVEVDRSYASPKTVLMTFYNGWLRNNVNVTFDFTNLTIDNPGYMFYTRTKLSFVADFTDNDPERLTDVTLWTLSSNNEETAIPMTYDITSGKWIGAHDFDYYSAPVNLTLEYTYDGQKFFDRRQISDHSDEMESALAENIAERAEFIDIFEADLPEDEITLRLAELFSQEEPDEDEVRRLLDMLDGSETATGEIMSDEEFENLSAEAEASWNEWQTSIAPEIKDQVLSDYFADPEYDLLADYEISGEFADCLKTVSKTAIASVDVAELEASGYSAVTLDDGSSIYVLYKDSLIEVIDCGKLVKYSIVVEAKDPASMVAGERIGAEVGSYLTYAFAAKNAINAIFYLSTTDRRRWLVDVAGKIDEATDGISRFYESFMTDFNRKIQEAYSRLSILCDDEIEKQEALAEEAQEQIREYTKKIESNKQQREVLKSNRDFVKNSTNIPEDQKELLIKEYDEQIKNLTEENKHLNGKRAGANTKLNLANSRRALIKEQSGKFRKVHTAIRETIDKFPKRLVKSMPLMPKWLRCCGKLAGELGIPLQCWSLFMDMVDMSKDISEWIPVMDRIDAHRCYKKKEPDAVTLRESIYNKAESHATQNVGILASEIAAIGFSIAGGVPGSPTWWAELGISVVSEVWKHFNDKASVNDRKRFRYQIGLLKCDGKDDDNDNDRDKDPDRNYPFDPAHPIHDPAGYVYEAVPENRVEGVQATIYYKETKEDMYGDLHEEIVLWNAEEYAQNNPLFTDENGMYRWDVPQGLWQVKFEKDGYVTAYSEWLPVPPPQLEVNIGIVQNRQPEITEARAYEEGVEVQFDKYMDLSTLTTDNIYVTANGEKLNGEIRMIDSALADEYASEEDPEAVSYASRVRFVPEQALSTTTGEVRLTVSRNVLSYAGIPMTETFSQVLDVEKEVQTIYADDVKVLYGGAKEVTVFAVPFDAAAGRTLRISNSSDLIASIDATEAVLDAEGKAVVVVTGGIPGRTQLNFTIDDVTATGSCAVDVVTEIITAEAPKASRASGTAVYRGTKVELTTESKNGVIWFTTDGSCPCDANGTRRKYTVPIIINDDTKILAMTSVGDNESDVSETAEFNYTLKRSDMEFQMAEGWTWMSHNFYDAIAPADLISDENVSRILSQTREVIRDPQLGMVGTLTELTAPESYKVETTAATVRQRHSDVAWNPATPIALSAGWNWLGYPAGQTMTVDEAFATTEAETLDVIVGQNGFAQFDGENWVGTLETMSPGMGYMYQSQSAKDVVYNTTIVSNASARHATGITGNTPLVLDIHKYGVIMPVVATLSGTDGSMLENDDYQVAAFCGSECRGIGRVVNGLVMMNVYGAVNDPITFSVTDADGELGFSTDTSIDFSETVVGDIYNPFVVTINNGNGISDVTYGGNILVTVENDMLRIRGIAAEDIELVEVYDIDGRKLIRETYVTESGIRISGLNYGAYVVIVKGNGEYTYHKIAVR